VTQLEASHSTDLTGFPPDLTAPPRPAIPRRTGQLPLGTLDDDPSAPTAGKRGFAASSCMTASSPLSSLSGSPMIDVDDDLDELDDFDDDELDDDELDDDELGDGDRDADAVGGAAARGRPARGAMFGPGLYGPASDAAVELWARPPVALGAATLGERARRLGGQVVHKVLVPVIAIAILVVAMGGTWSTAGATPTTLAAAQPGARGSGGAAATTGHAAGDEPDHAAHAGNGGKAGHRELTGKLNLNTATEDQLMVLPSVGPAKAERIVTWRKKNGGFKRTADLRRVKGFGYKTFKKLEPYLDIKGDTTLAPK